MYENKKVLKSKLRFSGASETIIRDRLMKMLSDISKKRLSMVIAGAGYGKTTLIKQAISYFQLPAVWYRLDKYDSDFETFFSYLKAGIEEHLGKIEIPIKGEFPEEDQVEEILNLFLSEVENRIQEDLIIVLDDYYLVHDHEEVNRAVEFLIENMHHQIHLVLISRSEPPIKISHLRVRRNVLDLTESDLAFTVSEIEKLYSDVFQLSLQNRTLTGLQEKTGGWVAALILFFHSLKGKGQETADNDLLRIKGSHRIISPYLEENIYTMLPSETRDFLVKTSLLSKLKVEFCNQLLGISNSKEILSDLEKRHMFTFQLDDEKDGYTYHHIFQDFLKTKLQNIYTREEIRKIQLKTARQMETEGNDEEALEYYLECEQMEDAFRVIAKISTMLWYKGRQQRFKSYLKRIPQKYFDKEPWIIFLQSLWLELSGKGEEAAFCLKASHEAFLKEDVPHGAALCLLRLGYYHFIDGDYLKAERTFKSALEIFEDNLALTSTLYTHISDALALQGKFDQADQYYKKAIALLKNIKDSEYRTAQEGALYMWRGHRYLISGDFQTALDALKKSEQLVQNTSCYALIAGCCFLNAATNAYAGNFLEGLAYSEKGLKIVRDKELDDFFLSGWLHYSKAMNYTDRGNIAKAKHHVDVSLGIFNNFNSSWGKAMCCLTLYQIHRRSGDDAAADKSLMKCETALGLYKVPWVEFLLKSYQTVLCIEKKDLEKAYRLLEPIDRLSEPFKYLHSRIDFVWVRYFWAQQDKDAALQKLRTVLRTCRENHYSLSIAMDVDGLLPILAGLFAQGEEREFIIRFFSQFSVYTRPGLIDMQKDKSPEIANAASAILKKMPVPPLEVCCLGEFKLQRGNAEVPAEIWTNQKAKLLFKFLLTERTRGFIPKDVLIEMLWPEQDIEKTINRFRVTLSALRKTLEPELVKGMTSSYILNDADGYKLSLGNNGSSDIDEFTEQMRFADQNKTEPEKSIHHYLKAEAAYAGEFLSEDLYVDWISEKRDHYRDLYLHLISRIMNYYENQKDFLKCIEYANKYLCVDAYAENIYQVLMRQYSQTGNMAMVLLTYEKCKNTIEDDLCSPLSQKTKSLYEELILEQ